MKKWHKIFTSKVFYFVCIFLFFSSNTQANFIELYDSNVPLGDGPNNITRDTETGLEWLDIWSSHDISDPLSIESNFEGFRFANHEELETFFANAGLTTGDNNDYDSLIEFLRLVGFNYGTPYESLSNCTGLCFTSIWGIYDSGLGIDNSSGSRSIDNSRSNNYATAQITINHNINTNPGYVNFFTPPYSLEPILGTEVTYWLVRDSVNVLATPEPTTFALLGIGLAGLGGMARRHHKNRQDLS